jgi:hypothetical protein
VVQAQQPGRAFVIMQIGDAQMDAIYDSAISPAIRSVGLDPRRIDQNNEGGLLNAEIMSFIDQSDLIVADLTNERPNCYLEVGYALGLGRQRRVILTVRCDHLPDGRGYVVGGPKVHFDLAGYDLLLWDPEDVDRFREDLARRIQRRLAVEGRTGDADAAFRPSEPWWTQQRHDAIAKITDAIGPGAMELAFELVPPKVEASQRELLDAESAATIRTFGWPIGLVLDTDENRPRPTGDGIRAMVDGTRWDDERSSGSCGQMATSTPR